MTKAATPTRPDATSGLLGLLGDTRAAIVSAMADGERSVAELSDMLGISQVAVRRHLTRLVDEGWVAGRTDAPDGPGRPATRYLLTADGHQLLPQGYAALAAELLAFIQDTAGQEGLAAYLDWRARRRVQRLSAWVDADTTDARLAQLAEALTEIGSTATVEPTADGFVLRQHHCTVMDVAREHPALCQAEADEFSRVIGGDVTVQRGASRASGDGTCECAVVATADLATGDRRVLPMAVDGPAAGVPAGNTSPT